jgi:hypothetical protein
MNTQAHAIINVALLNRKDKPHLRRYMLLGALIPDLPMFVFFVVETFGFRHPQQQIWSERYFLTQWQNLFDIFNAVPLALIVLGVGYWFKSDAVMFCCWSILLHCGVDFFLHHDDAHRHFFPFLQFRFRSPISYWDPSHYGRIASLVEIVATILASIFLFPHLQSRITRSILFAVNFLSVLVYVGSAIFFN